ncbi:hypothetical protein EVAR_51632_1 [Eumeta japonica]|uniref:Uncharacterized protein n=1 Tax=Eumeta variegata TaxID=151549 RepID=A0A4C1YGW9_EUMVA|nr:hypothetical protein EVAR_51632_1 [Eumeta japonica]
MLSSSPESSSGPGGAGALRSMPSRSLTYSEPYLERVGRTAHHSASLPPIYHLGHPPESSSFTDVFEKKKMRQRKQSTPWALTAGSSSVVAGYRVSSQPSHEIENGRGHPKGVATRAPRPRRPPRHFRILPTALLYREIF